MIRKASFVFAGLGLVSSFMACGDPDPQPTPTPVGCDAAITATDSENVSGDTSEAENLDEGTCIFGKGREVRYAVVPTQTGMLDLTLTSAVDLGMYVRTACADAMSEIGCADLVKEGQPETLSVPVTEGEKVWVVIEGYDENNAGAFSLDLASRPIVCGDGKTEGADEQCDPPDAGVTCTAACKTVPEKCGDGVDNDLDGLADCEDTADCGADAAACPLASACSGATPSMATQSGDVPAADGLFAGSCTGGALSPEALYTFAPPMDGALLVTLKSATNQGVYVRATCAAPDSELGCLDDAPGGTDETLVVPVVSGAGVTIFVDAAKKGDGGPFTLDTSFQTSTELEPNETSANATTFMGPYVAAIDPAGDVDFIAIEVPSAGSTLKAEIQDFGNSDCANFKVDTIVEIFGPDGTTSLALNDDTGNFCSLAEAPMLEAGTYFVKVSAAEDAPRKVFAYRLALTVQ